MRPPSPTVLAALLLLAVAPPWLGCRTRPAAASANSDPLAEHNRSAMAAHEKRCLGEASRHYAAILRQEPPVELTDAEWRLVLDHAPRLRTTPTEPFPLIDVVALIHPSKPWIAYHLFWDDDIDFPEDNDPTDHEIIWVRHDPATLRSTEVITYFHGTLLRAPLTADRPEIGVEWGKHGSVPLRDGRPVSIPAALERHWQTLASRGIRLPSHPHARHWPKRFDGGWADYLTFTTELDPRARLEPSRLGWRTRWGNATLNQHALRYNFAAKREWPE